MKTIRRNAVCIKRDPGQDYDYSPCLPRFALGSLLFFLINLCAFSNEAELVSLINQYRSEQGRAVLIVEEELSRTAEKYALELLEEGRLSHIDKDGAGVLNRYRESGGTSTEAGEILGTSTEISLIMEAWKKSPSHNSLILGEKWLRQGASVAESDGNIVAVVLFSISLIDSWEIKKNKGEIVVFIDSIEGTELIFPPHFISEEISTDKAIGRHYRIRLSIEELPRLIPVSREWEGIKKMTDFLYIGE